MARKCPATPKHGPYVYILHFDSLMGTSRHSARHYVGYARNWVWRVKQHHDGRARCAISRAFYLRGINFRVSLVVEGDQRLERRIKRSGHYDRLCPLCGGQMMRDYRHSLQSSDPR